MREWWNRLTPATKLFAAIAAVVLVSDQITKYLAIGALTRAFDPIGGGELSFFDRLERFVTYRHPPRAGSVSVLDDFWHFSYVENPGAAWGFLSGSASWFRTPFFLLVSVGAMIFIISYFRKTQPHQKILRFALALVFGGALGNFLDRVRLGYVIDFIDWHWYEQAKWPTFNVADSAISVGVVLMLLDMQKAKARDASTAAPSDGERARQKAT
jgi:signal peptidase II